MSETLVEKQPSVIWWINLENSSFLNFKNNEKKKANRKIFLQYKYSYQNRRIILEGREGMAIYSKKNMFSVFRRPSLNVGYKMIRYS